MKLTSEHLQHHVSELQQAAGGPSSSNGLDAEKSSLLADGGLVMGTDSTRRICHGVVADGDVPAMVSGLVSS